jgi:hypothetical protein
MALKKFVSKKTLTVATLSLLLIGVVLAGLAIYHAHHGKTSSNTDVTTNNAKKEAVIDNNGVPASGGDKGSTPNTDYTPPTDNAGITITPRTSGTNVIVSTKLAGYSDGKCTLTVTNSGQTSTLTADVIYAPGYSTCAGFSIPKATLGAGTWNITLNVDSGGSTTSKSATYEVAP